MRFFTKVVVGFFLVSSVSVFSMKRDDESSRMEAVDKINSIYRASDLNQKKIKAAIADLRSGKITQEEYDQGRASRAWPDFAGALDDARLIYAINPKDEHGLLAMKYMLSNGPDGWDNESGEWDTEGAALRERQQIGNLLLKHHIDHPGLWGVARLIGLPDMLGIPFFEKLYQSSSDKPTRARAAVVMAGRYAKHTTLAGIAAEERRESTRKAREWAQILLTEYGETESWVKARAEKVLAQLTQVIGEPMANIQAKSLQGEDDQVSNYQGKVVLIDLWATWCSPCKAALPELFELNAELEGKPFQLISMSVDDDAQDVIDYIEDEQPMPWVNWHVGRGNAQIKKLGIVGYPTYFLVDEKGILRAKGNHFGNEMRAELLDLIDQLSQSSE